MSNLKNRVSELEEKVSRLQKYIIIRDGLWIEKHLDEIDDYILRYDKVGDAELRLQLEFDNLMMCRARLQENFLEYCRRATLQLEGILDWGLNEAVGMDPGKVASAWDKAQTHKENRMDHYTAKDFPDRISRADVSDSMETGFFLFYNPNFHNIDKINNQFWDLLLATRMRNLASHRSENADWKSRMTSGQKSFYENRKEKYVDIISSMKVFKGNILRYFGP